MPSNHIHKNTTKDGRNKSPKPAKPSPDFPLFAHRNGQWAKKIKGRSRYFGPWGDPEKALNRFLAEKDDLCAGRTPVRTDGLTIRVLLNEYLKSKEGLVAGGELEQATLDEYKRVNHIHKWMSQSERPDNQEGPAANEASAS